MKIKEGFVVREVSNSHIVVPIGDKTVDFNGIMTLNETGRFLWDILVNGAEKEDLVAALLNEYNVDKTTAEKDIDLFLNKLKENEIAE